MTCRARDHCDSELTVSDVVWPTRLLTETYFVVVVHSSNPITAVVLVHEKAGDTSRHVMPYGNEFTHAGCIAQVVYASGRHSHTNAVGVKK